MQKNKIEDLQLLRGIAISMMLFCHLSLSNTLFAYLGKGFTNPFYWGVELFFVLSGFVVTKSIRSKHFNPMDFLVKRVFRLYPAVLFLICCAALINAFVINSTYPELIHNLFGVSPEAFRAQSLAILGGYFINFSDPISYSYGAMWSLSVEFQFYAAVTLLLVFLVPCTASVKENALMLIAVTIFFAVFIYRISISFATTTQLPWLSYLSNNKFDFMAAGVLLAYIPSEKLKMLLSFSNRPIFPTLALIATTLLLMMVRSPLTPNTASYETLNGIAMIFTLLSATYLVALGSIGGFSAMRLFHPVRHALVKLGDYSYTIYLIHFPVMVLGWMLINELVPFVFPNPLFYSLVQLFVVCLMLIPFVNFCYYHVELRSIAFGEKLLQRPPLDLQKQENQ